MIFPQTGEVPEFNLNNKIFKVEYWPWMVKHWLRMVKYWHRMVKYWHWMVQYWLLDGEILAFGWVNSLPEMLPEDLGTFFFRLKIEGNISTHKTAFPWIFIF